MQLATGCFFCFPCRLLDRLKKKRHAWQRLEPAISCIQGRDFTSWHCYLYLYGLSVQTWETENYVLQSENQTFPSIVLIHRLWTPTGSSGCYALNLVTRWTIRLDYIQGSIFLASSPGSSQFFNVACWKRESLGHGRRNHVSAIT